MRNEVHDLRLGKRGLTTHKPAAHEDHRPITILDGSDDQPGVSTRVPVCDPFAVNVIARFKVVDSAPDVDCPAYDLIAELD